MPPISPLLSGRGLGVLGELGFGIGLGVPVNYKYIHSYCNTPTYSDTGLWPFFHVFIHISFITGAGAL
jgi:hypothetical protein